MKFGIVVHENMSSLAAVSMDRALPEPFEQLLARTHKAIVSTGERFNLQFPYEDISGAPIVLLHTYADRGRRQYALIYKQEMRLPRRWGFDDLQVPTLEVRASMEFETDLKDERKPLFWDMDKITGFGIGVSGKRIAGVDLSEDPEHLLGGLQETVAFNLDYEVDEEGYVKLDNHANMPDHYAGDKSSVLSFRDVEVLRREKDKMPYLKEYAAEAVRTLNDVVPSVQEFIERNPQAKSSKPEISSMSRHTDTRPQSHVYGHKRVLNFLLGESADAEGYKPQIETLLRGFSREGEDCKKAFEFFFDPVYRRLVDFSLGAYPREK